MRKLLLSLALVLLGLNAAMAQSSLIATLSHEGQISAYYGINALKQAHDAAVDGDVINLTGGTFNATNINKAIILRGAGMLADFDANTFPTIISGDLHFQINNATKRLTIEGVKFIDNVYIDGTLNNPYFQKCIFSSIRQYNSSYLSNATFLNCYIRGWSHGSNVFNYNTTFINSYIWLPSYNTVGIYNSVVIINCVISFSGSVQYLRNSTITNSIFVSTANSDVGMINSNNVLYGCLATGTKINNIFANQQVGNNKIVSDITTVFKEFNGSNYSDDISFSLTDEAAATYLGTDSTQIGMFGGPLPFNPYVSTLKITRCNVASKSTVDGKLSVDIEVSGIE